MKKIKELLPLWIILLFFGSVYFMVSERSEEAAEYQRYLDKARNYAENEILTDAIENYCQALEIHSSPELYTETGDAYLKYGDYKGAQDWYDNNFYPAYPNDERTYEFGVRVYLGDNEYDKVFDIYEECRDRELLSETIESLISPIEYAFEVWGDYAEVRPFGNLSGIAAVRNREYWGYIDIKRERVLDYEYKSAGIFGDMAAVVDESDEAYFIDRSGNKKITEGSILENDPEMGTIEEFSGIESGLLWAYNGKMWNCYNAQSLEKIFGGYRGITNFSNGVGAVQNEESKWALISVDGTLITDFLYDEILKDQKNICCRTNVIIVKQGEDYLLLNKGGERIGSAVYEDACAFYDSTFAAVKKNGRWLYINGDDGAEIDLGTYEIMRSFSNNFAAVCRNGKWGYIDTEGKLVLDCQFDDAAPFGPNGVAFVKLEEAENWGLLSLYKYNHD